MTPSELASELGKLGRGKPKNYSQNELDKRRQRMIEYNLERKQKNDSNRK